MVSITVEYFVEISTEGAFGAQPAVTLWYLCQLMMRDNDKKKKKNSTWVSKAWCMIYEGARNKVLTRKKKLFRACTLAQKNLWMDDILFFNPEATTKQRAQADRPVVPMWLIVVLFILSLSCSVCVSLTLCLCLYCPFGLCHLRAYGKLRCPGWVWLQPVPYWDWKMEGFCQDYCLHRPREPVHTKMSQSERGQHTQTYVCCNVQELCIAQFRAVCLEEVDQNWQRSLFSVSPANNVKRLDVFYNCVCQALFILVAWPWFVRKLTMFYHLFPWIYLLWSFKFS